MTRWRRTPHRVWLPSLAAGLLLCAQMLGLVHAVHHLPGTIHAVAHVAGATSDDGRFGHGAGGQECRLFDHLTFGDLTFGVVPAIVPTPAADEASTEPPRSRPGERPWRACARGPPLA